MGGDSIAFHREVIELVILVQECKQRGQQLGKFLDAVFLAEEHKLGSRAAPRDELHSWPSSVPSRSEMG